MESARLPGNLRQLQNIIRKALLRSRGYEIERPLIEELLDEPGPDDLDELGDGSDGHLAGWCHQLVEDAAARGTGQAHRIAMETVEANLIREAMKRSGGNITNAAAWLGLSRLTVREKVKKYPDQASISGSNWTGESFERKERFWDKRYLFRTRIGKKPGITNFPNSTHFRSSQL